MRDFSGRRCRSRSASCIAGCHVGVVADRETAAADHARDVPQGVAGLLRAGGSAGSSTAVDQRRDDGLAHETGWGSSLYPTATHFLVLTQDTSWRWLSSGPVRARDDPPRRRGAHRPSVGRERAGAERARGRDGAGTGAASVAARPRTGRGAARPRRPWRACGQQEHGEQRDGEHDPASHEGQATKASGPGEPLGSDKSLPAVAGSSDPTTERC
jgi:hypothetical protein